MSTLFDRFWDKVEVHSHEDCWVWTGAKDSSGYGSIRDDATNGGKRLVASRQSLVWHTGKNPHDMYAMHVVCDNPPCVNPRHLDWGTPEDNVQDMMSKNRASWQKEENLDF